MARGGVWMENEMMRTTFPLFGIPLSVAVLAYCFLVVVG